MNYEAFDAALEVLDVLNEIGAKAFLSLLSAPKANDYYPKVGFAHHPRAWVMEAKLDPNKTSSRDSRSTGFGSE